MNDSRISLVDLGITHIDSGVRRYTIDSLIGKGGSSLVYKAFYVLNGYYKIDLIKELLPFDLYSKGKISRNQDGSVFVCEGNAALYERYISIAEAEQNTINELRFKEDVKNNEPYFFDQVDCFKANNTQYAVLATESGDTLLSLLTEKERAGTKKWPEDLRDVCQIALRILEALEPIHSRNKLHLDISPDNIFFSDMAVDGNRIARLIDFNSVIDLSTADNGKRCFSYKEGYSAPELSGAVGMADQKIGFQTDLYSVAAVMFRVLKGATTSAFPMHRADFWRIDDANPYCVNAPDSAIRLCNIILRKGLSPLQKQRYRSIAEMKSDLKRLNELCVQTPYSIKSNIDFTMLPAEVYGREDDLEQIEQKIADCGRAILSGLGGMGKTTLAVVYAKKHREAFDKIIFLRFCNSIVETVIDDANFPIYGVSRVENERDEDYYKRKLGALRKVIGEDSLLIFDGFDQIDNEMSNLLTLPCKIILTSRIDYSMFGVQDMKIGAIGKTDALAMFKKISGIRDGEEAKVLRLLEAVGYHTLTVELLARQMAYTPVTPDELLARINDGGLVEFDTDKVGSAKDRTFTYETIIRHVEKLFSPDTLSADERHLVYKMALLAEIGISKEAFNNFNGFCADAAVERLIALGWLQYSTEREELTMHPVTAEAVRNRCAAEQYSFDEFVKRCNEWMRTQYLYDQWVVDKKNKLQEQLIKRYNFASPALKMKVITESIDFLRRVGRIHKARAYAQTALALYDDCKDCLSSGHVAAMYNNIALVDLECGDYLCAKERLTVAARYMRAELTELAYFENTDMAYASYAMMLCNIGYAQILCGETESANASLLAAEEKARFVENKNLKAKNMAMIFRHRAALLLIAGEKEKAFELLEKSLQNASVDLLDNAEIYVSDLCSMSEITSDLKAYKAAEGFAKLALSATSEIISVNSERIKSQFALAEVYFKQGAFEKAYTEFEKVRDAVQASEFFSAALLIRFYGDFAFTCDKLKKYTEGVPLLKRALAIALGEDYATVSFEELNARGERAMKIYAGVNVCRIFFYAMRFCIHAGDRNNATIFYLLLCENKRYLDDEAEKLLAGFREKFFDDLPEA